MNPRILVLTLSTFAFGSAAFIFAGLLEPMARDLHVTTSVGGQLQTVYVLTSALFGPAVAFWLGQADRRKILMTALAAGLILNLGCAVAPNFVTLMGLRSLMGLAAGIAFPAASVAAASLVPPERRGSAVAMVMGGMTFAFLMGIPLGSVIGATFGWRATFVFAGGLMALALAGAAAFLPSVIPPAPGQGGRVQWASFLPFYLTAFFIFAGNMTVNLYIGPILRVGTGVTGAGVGAFQLMVGFGSFAGLFLGGRAADRGAGRTWVLAGFGAQALALGLHFAATHHAAPQGWPSYVLAASAIFFTAVTLFAMTPVVQSMLIRQSGGAPVALALNGSFNSVGQAVGSMVGGAALAIAGVPAIPAAAIGLSLIGLCVCAAIFPASAKGQPGGLGENAG